MNAKKTGAVITGVFIVLVCLLVIVTSIKVVPTGYTGVRARMGQISQNTISPGITFKIPFIDSIKLVNNKQQDVTIDGQIWSETAERTALYYEGVTITYQISAGRSAWILANVSNYEATLISPSLVSSAVKSASKLKTSIDATNRGIIEPEIAKVLQTSVDSKYGADTLTIIKVVVNEAEFEESYNQVIAEKQSAQIEYEKQQIENQKAIDKAIADATVKKTAAEAEAQALLIEAQAQADANELLEKSLTPNVLENKKIEKWDGKLPSVTGSEGGTIIDFGSVSNGAAAQ
ncbi:MAG: hypothetical protein MJ119_02960 [Lachnospiraceae bacterium]|nr:hypothetical protein [Lachnospiraceae bacterium]